MHWRYASKRASAVAGFYAPVVERELNRRSEPRRKCHAIGFLTSGDTQIPVLMRDVSARGARLSLSADLELTLESRIRLVVPAEQLDRSGIVVWEKDRQVGLYFDQPE